LSDENYIIAYNLLRDRYQNDRRLQLMHLNHILDLPEINLSFVPGIQKFVNSYSENMQALNAIDCEMPRSNPLLVALLLRKMDIKLRKHFELLRNTSATANHVLPTTKEILDFLNLICMQHEDASFPLSTLGGHMELSGTSHISKPSASISHSKTSGKTFEKTMSCAACNETSHKTHMCPSFLAKSPQERFHLVKSRHHCISCLGMHDLKACKSQSTCKICHNRHNTLLHFSNGKSNNKVQVSKTALAHPVVSRSKTTDTVVSSLQPQFDQADTNTMVLLGTVMLNIRTSNGITHTFRALLDSGSVYINF
jgi:hypothetical protein